MARKPARDCLAHPALSCAAGDLGYPVFAVLLAYPFFSCAALFGPVIPAQLVVDPFFPLRCLAHPALSCRRRRS